MNERGNRYPAVVALWPPVADFIPARPTDALHSLVSSAPTATTQDAPAPRPNESVAPPAPGTAVPETAPVPEPHRTTVVTGRVATTPWQRRTPKDQPVAGFKLAVPTTDGTTDYLSVLAFGDRAARLAGFASKGLPIAVRGYLHQREVTTKGGDHKTERSLYAVSWKARPA